MRGARTPTASYSSDICRSRNPRRSQAANIWSRLEQAEHRGDVLEVLFLQPLEEDDIRLFASHRSAPNVDGLIRELERTNLAALAGALARPA